MTQQQALYKYCLRLGDDALIQSYRLSEWCKKAPIPEKEAALAEFVPCFTNRTQDMLTYAHKINLAGKTGIEKAYNRGENVFYHHLLMKLAGKDEAFTIVKLLFTSAYEFYFYNQLQCSADEILSAIAAKTVNETKYHLAFATDRLLRLVIEEGLQNQVQHVVNTLWIYTAELFETDETDDVLCEKNIAADLSIVKTSWHQYISRVFAQAPLVMPSNHPGDMGHHKEIHAGRGSLLLM